MSQITLISGRDRRRHWSSRDRARILAAMAAPGAIVAEIARREDVSASLIYKWRREAREGGNAATFTPVIVQGPALASPVAGSAGETGVIVVELGEARVRIGADAPAALIAATLKALRS